MSAESTWMVRGSNGSSTTFEQSTLEVREHKEGAHLLVFRMHPEGGRRLIAAHEANWSFEEVEKPDASAESQGDSAMASHSAQRPK